MKIKFIYKKHRINHTINKKLHIFVQLLTSFVSKIFVSALKVCSLSFKTQGILSRCNKYLSTELIRIYEIMQILKSIKLSWYATMIGLCLSGCSNNDTPAVRSLNLSQTTDSLFTDSTLQLKITYSPPEADEPDVVWTTSNSNKATVDDQGLVTAHTPGQATITATTTNKKKVILTATTQLVIVRKATGISLDYSTAIIRLNSKKTLTATITPSDASYTDAAWNTSDSTIVTVNEEGILTGKALGTATVTATLANGDSPLSATCKVTIKALINTTEGSVVKLNTHTIDLGIPIILLGDGFTNSEVANGDYEAAMEEARDDLFSVAPITKLYQYFDVYYVTAISSSSTFGNNQTAFDANIDTESTHIEGNDIKCIEYARKAVNNIQHALIVVVLNINKYAGTTYMYYNTLGNTAYNYYYYSIAYCPMSRETKEKGMDFASLIYHEAVGHGLAKLGDEYYYEANGTIPQTEVSSYESAQKYGYYSNGNFSNDSTDVSWSSLLSSGNYTSEGLSVYEGGFTYPHGVYRPTETSIMNENTNGFNAPSRMAIYKYVNLLGNRGDWTFDLNNFLTWDKQFSSTSKSCATRSVRSSSSLWKPLHSPILVPINK